MEQAIQRTTIPWTIPRPHAVMQNWLKDVAASVRADNAIYSPVGEGRVPFIDTRDIAAENGRDLFVVEFLDVSRHHDLPVGKGPPVVSLGPQLRRRIRLTNERRRNRPPPGAGLS